MNIDKHYIYFNLYKKKIHRTKPKPTDWYITYMLIFRQPNLALI